MHLVRLAGPGEEPGAGRRRRVRRTERERAPEGSDGAAGCTDDPHSRGCEQVITQAFDSIEGVGELTQGVDGSMTGHVTGLVLEDRKTGELLEIPELALEVVPLWTTYTY